MNHLGLRPLPGHKPLAGLGRQTAWLYNTGLSGSEQMDHSSHKRISLGPLMRRVILWTAVVTLLTGPTGCARPGWRQQLQSEDPLQRIDGAVSAAKADDRTAVPLLIDRLEDDDEAVRMYAILSLQRIAGTTLGYKYWADPVDRTHMAQRWRDYAKDQNGTHAAPPAPARRQAIENHRQAAEPAPQSRPVERIPSTLPFAQEAT